MILGQKSFTLIYLNQFYKIGVKFYWHPIPRETNENKVTDSLSMVIQTKSHSDEQVSSFYIFFHSFLIYIFGFVVVI